MHPKEKLIEAWIGNKIINDPKIIDAFRKIPRENFILKESLDEAYGDYPLPIGLGQTISQPTTVMTMTQALELKETDKVLEIGSGCGYQTAIIASILKKGKIFSIEIIKDLAEMAKKNIAKLKIKNAFVLNCDGSKGYSKEAPYDKIIITAGCPKIPRPLSSQLKEGGIIVAPVGGLSEQDMVKGRKINGKLIKENLGKFAFVPLKGKHGHE